ncbi:hypothetical protein AMK23_26120 [Streptomyces sp. CB02130]|uniref:DNA-binding protein n=1 Tax=Streptomyces sp. CB02130 TaxID=1703934 RepID=UPI00093A0C4C|nr:DNA-binding protein [Streptomyces sp. CB02130]OKJ24318.1 hypothetical protein AMK23_26120 [Streptomyces sp. CB02130]
MTTTTAKKQVRPTAQAGGATDLSELVHYTPEQIEAAAWLPYSARTLRDKASARVFPHSRAGGRITFLPRHIREIAAMHEVRPAGERKRPAAA